MAKLKLGRDGMARLKASKTCEWPTGIHYTAGEERDVPSGYPGAKDDAPEHLERVTKGKAKKAKKKAEEE